MAPIFRHGKGTAVIANGYNLTEISNDSSIEATVDKAETTVYGLNDKTYMAGHADSVVTYAGIYDSNNAVNVTGEPHRKQDILVLALGTTSGTVNTYGSEGSARGRKARLFRGSPEGIKFSAPAKDVVKWEAGQFLLSRMAYGEWLVDPSTTLSGASTHTSVDGTVATTRGGAVHAHVLQYAATGTWTFKVQHSSNNSAWTDLTTSRSLNAATKYVRVETTGTIKRYVKTVVSAVTTGSAPRFGVAYGRHYT